MIVDRYAPRDLFALVPRLVDAFAPELRVLDRLLDDDALVRAIKAAMARRAPRRLTRGRRSTPVEVVRHSRRIVPITRSAMALARGAGTDVRTVPVPRAFARSRKAPP